MGGSSNPVKTVTKTVEKAVGSVAKTATKVANTAVKAVGKSASSGLHGLRRATEGAGITNVAKTATKAVSKTAKATTKAVSTVAKTATKATKPVVKATEKAVKQTTSVAKDAGKVAEKTVKAVAKPVVQSAKNMGKSVEGTVRNLAKGDVGKALEYATNINTLGTMDFTGNKRGIVNVDVDKYADKAYKAVKNALFGKMPDVGASGTGSVAGTKIVSDTYTKGKSGLLKQLRQAKGTVGGGSYTKVAKNPLGGSSGKTGK